MLRFNSDTIHQNLILTPKDQYPIWLLSMKRPKKHVTLCIQEEWDNHRSLLTLVSLLEILKIFYYLKIPTIVYLLYQLFAF